MVAVRRPPRRWILLLLAVIFVVLLTAGAAARFYTDMLWFQNLGHSEVFWGVIGNQISLGLLSGIGAAVIIGFNLYLAERLASRYRLTAVPAGGSGPRVQPRTAVGPYLRILRIGVSLFIGLIIGLQTSSQWETFQLWRNRVPFGETDPQFHRDIGFYVFELPMQRATFGWLFAILILTTLLVIAAHYLLGGIRPQDPRERVAAPVITHLSILVGLIVLLKAWAYRLDQFELLYSSSGPAMGASYTDVNASLPALQFLVGAAVLSAILFFYNARQRGHLLPAAGVLVLALVSILVGGAYPAFVQRFQVAPQELNQEEPYIQRNIDATKKAYGLADIEPQSFPAANDISPEEIRAHQKSIDSIRLWEPDTLHTAVSNLQAIGQYYSFSNMDVDRYRIDGDLQQVMIAAREVNPGNLQESARTWQNLHLAYTHGYGVVATQVNDIEQEGRPVFLNQGFSQEDAPIPVTQPRIYFGELPQGSPSFVVANTKQLEVGAPTETGEGAADFHYDGPGGVQLSNPLRRLAFALRFSDTNLVLSNNITSESRLMFDRHISERIEKVAPFLEWDGDPYVAVVDGRIKFIRDGYTTTDMYPYSQRVMLEEASRVGGDEGGIDGRANYIRNSVKAVVDAYTGSVKLYTWDEQDPLLKAWSKTFPDLFEPRSAIDEVEGLQEHFRYPQDLFAVQANRFQSYHIDEAREFYSKQDFWDLPADRSGEIRTQESTPSVVTDNTSERSEPYYLLTQLPGSDEVEFVMVTPYTPNNRANMVSYLAAQLNKDGSGKINLLTLPRARQTEGPTQVNANILADPDVARDITFFNQQGSQVTMGNLLTVPIEDSFLYVQPIFVQARGNAIPELKRVAVYFNGELGYAATLAEAMQAALQGGGSVAPPPP